MDHDLWTSILSGLGLGLGLIVAIGAQNAFVLRQGVRGEHVAAVVLCASRRTPSSSSPGVTGAGAVFSAAPWLVTVARWGGAAFLLGYAALAARRALRAPEPQASGLHVDDGAPEPVPGVGHPARPASSAAAPGAGAVTSTLVRAAPPSTPTPVLAVLVPALALTWLNPHVYLDTVVLLGSVGTSHGSGRWAFAAGAVAGSVLWFTALGAGARLLAPVFARPSAWRVLDGVIAVVMTTIALGLLYGD